MSERGLKQPEPLGDAARLLLAGSRERFTMASTDLLLPEKTRLTEWQRHTASALLNRLIRSVEDSLRACLASRFTGSEGADAALGSTKVEIALPLLERAGLLRDPDLGAILVRRVEEHRFWKENAASATHGPLAVLIGHRDEAVASDAMAVLIALSRRFDRFQEPLLGHSDLPAEFHHRFVWMIAAALRQYLVQRHQMASATADAAIADAALEQIGSYDEGKILEASAMRLARSLHRAGEFEGEDVVRMLDEGLLPMFVAGLAVRCALDYEPTWEILSDPQGRGPAFLLRSARIGRSEAAWILLALNSRGRLFSGIEGDAAAIQLDLFDNVEEIAAIAILRLWQVDPGYRAAISRLSTRRPAEAA